MLPKVERSEPRGVIAARRRTISQKRRRSGRDPTTKGDPSDVSLLADAMVELRRVWKGAEPALPWKLQRDASAVPGLHVCKDFLSAPEVDARLLPHSQPQLPFAPTHRATSPRWHAAHSCFLVWQVEALRTVLGAHRAWTQYTYAQPSSSPAS